MIRSDDPDTIVAIATPVGSGAIGVIRVSGPGAITVASGLVHVDTPCGLQGCLPRVLYVAEIVDPRTGAGLDRALVVKMLGPASYTGEDIVEISCHGNPVLLAETVRHLVMAGARLAEPGEFTRRAYLNGRMDLLQVEAVAELIGARTERAIRLAARQLKGTDSSEIKAFRERLLDLMVGLEVTLDFPEENVGTSRGEAMKEASDLRRALDLFFERGRQGRTVQDGLTVVLVGAPNVGKSSLLNCLLGSERAIVSPLPGTTRDLVEGTVRIHGVPVRLVDGAGLGVPRDSVDAEGMRRVRQILQESDLAIVVLDASRPVSATDGEVLGLTAEAERLVVVNKSDLPAANQTHLLADCVCSALTGNGIDVIAEWLARWVQRRTTLDGDEGGILASLRVLERLRAARTALSRVADIGDDVPIEAMLVDLGQARKELDHVLGIEADEAVLDRIFSSFCIGK